MKDQLNKNNSGFGALHFVQAFGWSMKGLSSAIREEAAFRQELLLFCVLTPLAFWLAHSGIERAILVGSMMLVLVVELLNSAVESVVDRISTEMHPLSGRAKDLGSAAVFLTLINAACMWGMILLG